MKPAAWFVKAISILDPLLSVRWGAACSRWVIQRRGVFTPEEIGYLKRRESRLWQWVMYPKPGQPEKALHTNRMAWINVKESLVSAEAGCRVIIMPDTLNQATYDMLCQSDINRYGGYAHFADTLEASEERAVNDHERIMSNKRQALAGEDFDMRGFIEKKKMTALAHGERDMRYLLHGVRSTEESAPLIKLTDM